MSDNPYAPTLSVSSVGVGVRYRWRWVPLVLLAICMVAYHGFVLLLLKSGSNIDKSAGGIMLLNTPILALWFHAAYCGRRAVLLGGLAMLGQVVAGILIVTIGGAADITAMFMTPMVLAWGVITLLCRLMINLLPAARAPFRDNTTT